MYPSRTPAQLLRFFAGLSEYVFETRLGVADPPLIEYLSELLARFIRFEAIYNIRSLQGRPLNEVGQMLVEADHRLGDAKREVHRHIGDFTLFWAGVYPEMLKRLQTPQRVDQFIDYCQQGKRSYYIASTMRSEENEQESGVLERISHDFDLCVYGLSEVRKEWERKDPESGFASGPILIE